MSENLKSTASGDDYFNETRSLGISRIDYMTTSGSTDGLFILENTFHAKGGPAKHLHYDQDEWFCCIEGIFIFEIGNERFKSGPGDSILAPRKIPHVWAPDEHQGGLDLEKTDRHRSCGVFP